MTHTSTTRWVENLVFDGQIDKHTIRIDSGSMGSDAGPGPKKLLLVSLAGCTAMDVVSLLQKMREPFTGFEIDVEADLTEEHPKVYSEMRLVYRVFGKGVNLEKVKKAVTLSKEKYCGVSAMLEKNCPIRYQIELVDEQPA